MNNDLSLFSRNVTSQFGEDGILEEILNRIGVRENYCVEFGAWDGKHLSNTWNLWHEKGWSALLIEGEADRVNALEKSLKQYPKVRPYCAFVGLEGDNRLDVILKRNNVPQEFDVLSIDVDGDDYHIFKSIEDFRPRVILVEYNPTIPPHIELIAAPGNYFGASALSILKLAKTKNYSLAACTTTNLILVRNDEYAKLGFSEPKLSEVMPTDAITYVVTSYSGDAYLTQSLGYKHLRKLTLRQFFKSFARELSDKEGRDANNLSSQLASIVPVSIFKSRRK